MADLTIAPADVGSTSTNAQPQTVTAGEAIDAGELVYLSADDTKYYLADGSGTQAQANVVSVAMNSAEADGQPLTVLGLTTGAVLDVGGSAVVVGMPYCVSATAGKFRPITDGATGEFLSIVGIGETASSIRLGLIAATTATAADIT